MGAPNDDGPACRFRPSLAEHCGGTIVWVVERPAVEGGLPDKLLACQQHLAAVLQAAYLEAGAPVTFAVRPTRDCQARTYPAGATVPS